MRVIGDVSSLSVLDYGCGSGGLCLKLQALGAKTYGCDISEKFLEVAKQRDLQTEYSLCGNSTEYDDHYFDLVISNFVLFVTEHYRNIVSEMARITALNGRTIVTLLHPENYRQDELDLSKQEEYLQDKLGGVVPFTYHRRTSEVYENLFQEVGFQILEKNECQYTGDKQSLQKYSTKPFFLIYVLQRNEGAS